jgi:pimeloyl-ACP methyl ester carboxylesterase
MLKLEHQVLHPHDRRHPTPLLLMHGAWHGAWCWQAAMADFAARGFEVHAISWRGHGASDQPRSINTCGLRDYVNDLSKAIDAIEPRPVVVGHSMGGYVAQLYITAARHTAPLPGVVLLCSAPPSGVLRYILHYARRHPLAYLRGIATGNLLHMVGTPELAREAFFRKDIAPDELERYRARLVPESLRVAIEASLLVFPDPRHASAPVLTIAAERDTIFTLDEQRALAQAYNSELLVIPAAAHDLMLDPAWHLAADAIEGAVGRWEK